MDEEIEYAYKSIARQISSPTGQCVLILGPELTINSQGVGYKSYFKSITPDTSKYFDSENLFMFGDRSDTRFVMDKVTDYYRTVGDPAILDMISRIKFPLIVNVCPDLSVNKTFKNKNIPFLEGYFATESKIKFDSLSIPTKELPIIYNIFGSIDVEQSLVFTHKKMYETMEHLLPKKSLPDNIELFLKETANSFIFLGFKFDSWHYQLVCHKLGINANSDSKINISTPKNIENENVTFLMNNSFDMKFTADNPNQCLHNIIEQCERDYPDSLREKNPNGSYSTFISYARNDDTNDAREHIVDLIELSFKKNNTNNLYSFFRDRNDLKFNDSIDSFMTHIGIGKTIIRVITQKYLTSYYCMLEAYRMHKYVDNEKRIFTIVLDDARIHEEDHIQNYKEYWFNECQEILKNPTQLENRKYDDYVNIYRFIDDFITLINDQVYLNLNYSDLSNTNEITISENKKQLFEGFMNEVFAKLQKQ